MSRTQTRQVLIGLLYAADINGDFSENFFLSQSASFPTESGEEAKVISEDDRDFLWDILRGIMDNKSVLDNYISEGSEGWTIDRIGRVELAVLRGAIYELLFRKDIPIEVVVNEAVENSKRFGKEDSYRFVNGVLAYVIKKEIV